MERWLSLTISDRRDLKSKVNQPFYLICVPKKIVKKAFQRNRVKRVLREALKNMCFSEGKKVYRFKIVRCPASVNLRMAQEALRELSLHV